jgi:hypothetical protein
MTILIPLNQIIFSQYYFSMKEPYKIFILNGTFIL